MSHSRSVSNSSSRSRPTSGSYTAPQPSHPAETDFCNAFWVFPGIRQNQGDGDKADWGKEGYDALQLRMRTGLRTLEELKALFKERLVAGLLVFIGWGPRSVSRAGSVVRDRLRIPRRSRVRRYTTPGTGSWRSWWMYAPKAPA